MSTVQWKDQQYWSADYENLWHRLNIFSKFHKSAIVTLSSAGLVGSWNPHLNLIFLYLVGRRCRVFGKNYGTMYQQIKSKDSFIFQPNVALPTKDTSLRLRNHSSTWTCRIYLLSSCRRKMTPWLSKVADQTTNRCFFLPKNWTCLIFFVGLFIEAYMVSQTNYSDRPNMSISTNLSVTCRWPQYNEKTNNICRPTKQISHTDQISFLCSTSRPFYASHRRDSSVCGIPALDMLYTTKKTTKTEKSLRMNLFIYPLSCRQPIIYTYHCVINYRPMCMQVSWNCII